MSAPDPRIADLENKLRTVEARAAKLANEVAQLQGTVRDVSTDRDRWRGVAQTAQRERDEARASRAGVATATGIAGAAAGFLVRGMLDE